MKLSDQFENHTTVLIEEIQTAYGLTGRFFSATDEAAYKIHGTASFTLDNLLRGMGSVARLVSERKDDTPIIEESKRDATFMLVSLCEIARGLTVTIESVAYESVKYQLWMDEKEFGKAESEVAK